MFTALPNSYNIDHRSIKFSPYLIRSQNQAEKKLPNIIRRYANASHLCILQKLPFNICYFFVGEGFLATQGWKEDD